MSVSLRLPAPLCPQLSMGPETSRSLASGHSVLPALPKTFSTDHISSISKAFPPEPSRIRLTLANDCKPSLLASVSLPPSPVKGKTWISVKAEPQVPHLPPVKGAKDAGSHGKRTLFQPASPSVNHATTPHLRLPKHSRSLIKSLLFVQSLPSVDPNLLIIKRVALPKRTQKHKKTIVFDLDETLVHCCGDGETADVRIEMKQVSGENTVKGVRIRPFARECLAAASELFEVVVFTAAHRYYADAILDHLDPTGELIQHRLYREHCLLVRGQYVKDLRILAGRDLSETFIVDNQLYSFGYQLDNGIPIKTWREDRCDRELLKLIDFLKHLADAQDVRTVLRATFQLRNLLLTQ